MINLLVFQAGIIVLHKKPEKPTQDISQFSPIVVVPEKPINYTISEPVRGYPNYNNVQQQLVAWKEQAPELIEIGVYGNSTKGTNLYYAEITRNNSQEKPVVMVTACIHGDEPLSACIAMSYIGTLLDQYGDNDIVTKLLDENKLCFIPVISPDSFPSDRYVDGVDPNRDFPSEKNPGKTSVKPIAELQKLFLQHRPKAVMSLHSSGRVYLIPWGDRTSACPHDAEYRSMVAKMSQFSHYRFMQASRLYNEPIFGSELDWYYRNDAFAMVTELGTHQRAPSRQEIMEEFDLTWKGFLYFCVESPSVR